MNRNQSCSYAVGKSRKSAPSGAERFNGRGVASVLAPRVTLGKMPAINEVMSISRERSNPTERMERLFRSHYASVVRYVRSRTSAETADDAVAETFLVAWRRLEEVPEEPLPWLLGVARNVIATQQRGARRRSALSSRLQDAVEDDAHASGEELSGVAVALASLPEKDREALTLIAWDGLAPKEAATVMGTSAGAFRVRLHRAKRRLRTALEAHSDSDKRPTSRPLQAKEHTS
jgi:RNA polymerase sigma-70 factor, ECF subfamily